MINLQVFTDSHVAEARNIDPEIEERAAGPFEARLLAMMGMIK
jgi:hypothetical protein